MELAEAEQFPGEVSAQPDGLMQALIGDHAPAEGVVATVAGELMADIRVSVGQASEVMQDERRIDVEAFVQQLRDLGRVAGDLCGGRVSAAPWSTT